MSSPKESNRRMTMPEAIRIQKEHLDGWSRVLQPAIFRELEQWAWGVNNSTEDPYEIPKWDKLLAFVRRKMQP